MTGGMDETAPAPLVAVCRRRVRFEEVDMLRIVWHGHYVSFLDDGRVALGEKYPELGYQRLIEAGVAAPVVRLNIDYRSPLRLDEVMEIETRLLWTEAARLDYAYTIRGADGRIAAEAATVQLLTEPESGEILFVVPPWMEEFRERWRSGRLG